MAVVDESIDESSSKLIIVEYSVPLAKLNVCRDYQAALFIAICNNLEQ
jgi:hypothetical protein